MEETEDVRWLTKEVQRLRIEDGDVLVLKSPGVLAESEVKAIRAGMARAFPDVPVVILEAGMELGAVCIMGQVRE